MKRFTSFFHSKSNKNILLCTLLLFLFMATIFSSAILQATELESFPTETVPFSTEQISNEADADVPLTTEVSETIPSQTAILQEPPTIESPNEAFLIESFDGLYYVTSSGGLNVRSGPSIQYDIIGNLPYGEQISVTGKVQNDWFKIRFQETYGYVSAKYLSVKQPVALTPETEAISETQEHIVEEPVPKQETISFVSDTTIILLLLAIVTMVFIIIITVISFFRSNHKYQ